MNPSAIYSKSGKGVQEASGKTSLLKRADRAVLAAIDGRATLAAVAEKLDKPFDAAFGQLIRQLDAEGFIREVNPGVGPAATKAPPTKQSAPAAAGEDLDFSNLFSVPAPKAPPPPPPPPKVDPKAKAEAERQAKHQADALTRAREEAEARAQKEREARQKEAEAKLRAEAEAKMRAELEKKGKADLEAKLRAESDAKVKAARDAAVRAAAEAKARAEADMKAKVEAERRAREEAERKAREEVERARREAEEKAKAESDRMRRELEEKARAEAEKARAEAEALRRQLEEERRKMEEERKRREEEERARKEAEERARREEEERRRREEEERKRREEEERARREAEERARREEEERRRREEEERRRREEEERKRREEEERARKEAEERARRDAEERARREAEEKARREAEEKARREAEEQARRREEEERAAREARERAEREEAQARRAREEEERRRREDEDRRRHEDEERRRREDEDRRAAEALAKASAETTPKAVVPPAAAKPAGDFADNLLADLDSFGQREEEERKAKEAAELKARQEAEQRAREEAERRRREEEEEHRRAEAERRAAHETEQRVREEEDKRNAAEAERKRKVQEALAASRRAAQGPPAEPAAHAARPVAKAPAGDDDIGITDEDLDLDDVKQDQKALRAEARRAAREREREGKRTAAAAEPQEEAAPERVRRPVKWGKPVAITLVVLLAVAIGAIHVMPIGTSDYEKAASEALGRPVTIGSARLSLFTGVQLKLDGVAVGEAKIPSVRASVPIGSLFGERKHFTRIELDNAVLPQQLLGEAVLGKVRTDRFSVGRVSAKQLKLDGPLPLPTLDATIVFDDAGAVSTATLQGPDALVVKISPKGDELLLEASATSFTVPIAPELTLGNFGMKGAASRQGMEVTEWDGKVLDGTLSGNASLRWGSTWTVDGVITARAINAAVFAPALVSEGRLEGTAKFSLSGPDPAKLIPGGRMEGNFTVTKGALGSFDLSKALQTGGRQTQGRTPFNELTGQGSYSAGAVSARNVSLSAGALNAGASLDIAPGGALSGRIIADVRAGTQALRATLNIGGTLRDPQVKN